MANSVKLGLIASAFLVLQGGNLPAHAENSVVTQPKKYDRKIEAAAIKKAAEKIGSLRGSLSGDLIGEIIREEDLNGNQSTQLGFPIIQETIEENDRATTAVPMV